MGNFLVLSQEVSSKRYLMRVLSMAPMVLWMVNKQENYENHIYKNGKAVKISYVLQLMMSYIRCRNT